ncbi:hypothetical protein ACFQXB_05270 [Plastorhodobacter daqingensis]|uniref:Uncharacterized protein n=1 Tax=Plastorhodobacter daqingensis TaxID=1387281 RepID=A0ABW2UG06_9RHOB
MHLPKTGPALAASGRESDAGRQPYIIITHCDSAGAPLRRQQLPLGSYLEGGRALARIVPGIRPLRKLR